MPAPKPSITCLFTWLAVAVLLLAGAPGPRRADGGAGAAQRLLSAHEFAEAGAVLALAPTPDPELLPEPKAGGVADLPATAGLGVTRILSPDRELSRPARNVDVPRLSVVGMVELRL